MARSRNRFYHGNCYRTTEYFVLLSIIYTYLGLDVKSPMPPPTLNKSGVSRQILVKKSPVSNSTIIRQMGAALIRGIRRTELIGAFSCLCQRSKKLRCKDIGKVLRGTVGRQVHVLQSWLLSSPPAVSCSSVDVCWTHCLHTVQCS